MTKLRFIRVMLAPWKWEGCVAVGGSTDDVASLAKDIGLSIELSGHERGRAVVEMGKPWLLWLESLDDPAVLAHEALHIASGVLEQRGLKHTADSEEAYTYTMEDLMRKAMTAKRWERFTR